MDSRKRAHGRFRKSDPAFEKLQNEIAVAWRARAVYLLAAEPRLAELKKLVKERKKQP